VNRAASGLLQAASSVSKVCYRFTKTRRLSANVTLSRLDAQVLPEFLEGSAESLGRFQSPEAEHRVVTLLEGPMVLFDPIVQIPALPMEHVSADDPANGFRVGGMLVRGDMQRLLGS
jgi:hypothetical protein